MRALLAAHKVLIEFCVAHRLRGTAEPLDPSENLDPDVLDELRAFAHVGKCLSTEEKVSQWLYSSPSRPGVIVIRCFTASFTPLLFVGHSHVFTFALLGLLCLPVLEFEESTSRERAMVIHKKVHRIVIGVIGKVRAFLDKC